MADVLYKSNSCAGCMVVENALASKPIPELRIMNIDTDPTARQYFMLTGSRCVPTAVIDGQPVTGASLIINALRRKYGRP